MAAVLSACLANGKHMDSTTTPVRIMRGKNHQNYSPMKEKALKVLKLLLKFLPMLINLLDAAGDKIEAHIHDNCRKNTIV